MTIVDGEPRSNVLEVRGLGKRFARNLRLSQRYGTTDILRELRPFRQNGTRPERRDEFWAVKDIDFSLAPGEALGVIGHNGAGKSTLLRLLNGLLLPDAGSIEIRGTRAALIDLGAPFDTMLTARENIETSALIQGIDRSATTELIRSVAEFAELEHVLDAPIRTLSKGMQLRLGYAVAAQMAPDLMLVDEVIAVGDISFQRKCVQHIHSYLNEGGALVLVSHDLWMIQALCARSLVISDGRVVEDTDVNRAISSYLQALRLHHIRRGVGDGDVDGSRARDGLTVTSELGVESLTITGEQGGALISGSPAVIEILVRTTGDDRSIDWEVDILMASQQTCVARLHANSGSTPVTVGTDGVVLVCRIPDLPLLPGLFYLTARFRLHETDDELSTDAQPVLFEVVSSGSQFETVAQISGVVSSMAGRYELVESETGR